MPRKTRKSSRQRRAFAGFMVIKRLRQFGFLLLAGLAIAVLSRQIRDWVNESKTFSLQTVVINGNKLLNSEDILSQIDLTAGAHVTELNLNAAQNAVERHPYVRFAQVSRKFPASISIDIIERVPVAFVAVPDKPIYAIDGQGVLMPVLKDGQLGDLPVITGLSDFDVLLGEPVALARMQDAIILLGAIQSSDSLHYRRVSEVNYDAKKGFVAFFEDGQFPVYFGYEQFNDRALNHRIFLKQAAEENRLDKIRYVDLRFEEQVVVKFNP